MAFARSEALLELAHAQKVARFHQRAQLAQQGHMLAHIAAQALEFGVRLDEAFHILHRLDRGIGRRARLELHHVLFDRGAEIAKVVVQVGREERIVVHREHNLLRALLGVHRCASIVDAQLFVHHGLVRPRGE